MLASTSMQLLLDFAYLTKLRQTEILNIERKNITDAGILVFISKNNRYDMIEWTDALRDNVNAAIQLASNSLYLFPNQKSERYTSDGFKANWQRLIKKAENLGVIDQRFTFHDIRAMAVTYTANKEGIEAASLAAGHSSTTITKRVYVRSIQKRKPTQ